MDTGSTNVFDGLPDLLDRLRGRKSYWSMDASRWYLGSRPDADCARAGVAIERLHHELVTVTAERDRLDALINTPELVDFAKAVHMEAVHQEVRWGTEDREGKAPYDWHWLVAHLAGRALAAHAEADRLQGIVDRMPENVEVSRAFGDLIRHHREKAVHHTITAAAALAHWHASMLGKHTTMQPGHAGAAAMAEMACAS